MKLLLLALIASQLVCSAFAQRRPHFETNYVFGLPFRAATSIRFNADSMRNVMREHNRRWEQMPRDPWRIINGKTNFALGPGWIGFGGSPLGKIGTGTLFSGTIYLQDSYFIHQGKFIINNYTNTTSPNALGTALPTGKYVRHLGENQAMTETPVFEYFTPLQVSEGLYKELWEHRKNDLKAAKEAAATNNVARKTVADSAALKFNQAQAEKGEAQGLFRMGERYRDGDGVEQDLAQARDHFTRARAAGHPDAANALEELKETP